MDHDLINEKHSKSIILNETDNIIIALDNMKAGQYLKNFDVTIDAPILSDRRLQRLIFLKIAQYINMELS